MQKQPDSSRLQELKNQLAAVTAERDATPGIPPACYADTDLLKQEQLAIFQQGWVCVGRADRWPAAGDFSTMDIAGVPLIVLRNKAGELKSFANSCRHRGSKLLNGEGNCKKIKCPFHWWTYDLDGRLKVYARMENAQNFDPDDFGLVEFPLHCEDGFAFTSFDSNAVAFEEWIGDFATLHAPWALSGWKTTRLREFEVDCNWKSFIEVFNEYYHLPMVHADSINWLYPEPDPVDTVSGQYTTQFGATEGNAALLADSQQQALPNAASLSGRERSGTRYSWVYPNMTFAASQDSLWMYQAFPITPERSHIVQSICFPAETVEMEDFESRAQHYYQRIDAALAEDLPFLQQQQKGLNSRFAQQGRFTALEPSVANFAYWYSSRMAAALKQG